ncbi:MAG: signal recognition particle protein, partial [Propionibacteriaceae bacterium]|nr:signal recognition particle protein [Propionibacteriaceae bacterium]
KVSGNPAKRANGPAARPDAPAAAPAAAFGQVPSEADLAKAVGDFQLPPELQQLFNPKNTGPR